MKDRIFAGVINLNSSFVRVDLSLVNDTLIRRRKYGRTDKGERSVKTEPKTLRLKMHLALLVCSSVMLRVLFSVSSTFKMTNSLRG